MKQIKIGAITIGQAPRTDITRDILPAAAGLYDIDRIWCFR